MHLYELKMRPQLPKNKPKELKTGGVGPAF
jgi:hypothetical protein